MIDPRMMYDVTVYDYDCLDPELKRYTDRRNHSVYVTSIKTRGDNAELTTVNLDGKTGKEYTTVFTIKVDNIYAVRNVKTGEYLSSLSPGLRQSC